MKTALLSLPNDVLARIVNFLLPSPSSNSFSNNGSMRYAISLSETCHRLRAVVVQQLSIADFLTPSSYTSSCCRTTQSCSLRIDSLIHSARHCLRVLHLPCGYIPRDAAYSAVRCCVNLRELSLPVREDLDPNRAHEFFSCFPSLEKLALDLPTPHSILGLSMSEIRLKDVAFTKLPANAASFNALSCFLGRNGPLLNRLRLDIFSEDTKQHYTSSLRGSWVYNEELIQISRVFPRLSAILGRHLEEKKLLSLRELDVSTIPDFPVGRQDDLFHVRNRNNLVHLELAVKSARDEHPNRKGLQTLRIRAPSDILDRSIAFTSQWIDPTVDITFSFPAYTVHFPQKATNANESLAEVKETMLAILTSQHASRFLAILGLPGLESIETLTFGKCLPTIPQQTGPRLSPDFISLPRFQRTKLKTIRFVCNIPDTAAVLTIATCLKEIDNAPVTVLREIEFPADLVMFSPAMESLATRSGHCVTALRISDFRNADVLERVEEAGTPHHHIISGGRITGAAQKAEWFLKGLPRFLYMVIHDFPMVETVYMEQTKATRSISDRHAISGALMAIDHFENASKADASTLKTEISAWSENPLPFGQDPLRCQGTTFCSDAKQYG